MGPRQLQSTIHSDFSINSNISWTQYRTGIKSLYEGSTSKVDYNNHLIREYNRKIDTLNHPTGLYIQPYDAGFRFKGTSITPEPASFFWQNWMNPPSNYTMAGTSTFSAQGSNLKLTPRSGLTSFNASYNYARGTIDASGCVNLTSFSCYGDYDDSIASLNLSGCTKLVTLVCESNLRLKSLDVSNCVNLQTINAYGSSINSINLLGCNNVTNIGIHNNQLKSLSISQCINLIDLDCSINQITSLDFSNSKNIVGISCYTNQLNSINILNCSNLTTLNAYVNSFTSVDVSGCTNFNYLNLRQNQLTQISVNDILIKINSFGLTSGYVNLTGGSNAAPSGDGLTAKAALIARSWTVLTN